MPEVLPTHVPAPRCVIGWDGTAYRAFAVDASGHIQTDVLTSALPAGAATAAHQLTMITALQLIDDLRDALASVAADNLRVVKGTVGTWGLEVTDAEQDQVAIHGKTAAGAQVQPRVDASGRASVRGEDQLFSFRDVLAVRTHGNPPSADSYIASPAVPAGQVWVVTAITVVDLDRALTAVGFVLYHNDVDYTFGSVNRAIAARESVPWSGHVYLDAGDTIQGYMGGCQAGDNCWIRCVGYRMTAET